MDWLSQIANSLHPFQGWTVGADLNALVLGMGVIVFMVFIIASEINSLAGTLRRPLDKIAERLSTTAMIEFRMDQLVDIEKNLLSKQDDIIRLLEKIERK